MFSVRNLACFLALLIFTGPVKSQSLEERLSVLRAEHEVPGFALAVVSGDSVHFVTIGFADAEQTQRVTADTRFRIASVAKVLVSATVLGLVRSGKLDLHADISGIVPSSGEFSGPFALHDLLTHTAGFDERFIGYAARSPDEMVPLGEYLRKRMPERGWPAGEQISYSNHGMALAAFVAENATGAAFASLAREQLLKPLGMHSTFFLSPGGSIPRGTAAPLDCTFEDDIAACDELSHVFSHAYPAGLAFSTARDMSRFVLAVLASRAQNSSLTQLIPSRFRNDQRLPGMSYGFFNQYHSGVRFLSHSGSVPGYWSLLMIAPDPGLGLFLSANGGDAGFGAAVRDVILDEWSLRSDSKRDTAAKSEDPQERAGSYELTRYAHNTIERFPGVFVNSIRIAADADTLKIIAGGRATSFVQIGSELYQRTDGTERIAFGERRGQERLFRSSFVYGAGAPSSYERRSFRAAPGFLNEYVSWLLALQLLLIGIVWPIAAGIAVVLRRRTGRARPPAVKGSLSATLTATLGCGLFAWFGFGFVARSNRMLQSGELFFGMPDRLLQLTWIPGVLPLIYGLSVIFLIVAWKYHWWDRFRRVLFLLVVVLMVLQLQFLIEWNYLPLRW